MKRGSDEEDIVNNMKNMKTVDNPIDEAYLERRLKTIYDNVIKSPQYLQYIDFLIKGAVKSCKYYGPQYNPIDSAYIFSDAELAQNLVAYHILPPMPNLMFYRNIFNSDKASNKDFMKYLESYNTTGGSSRKKSPKKKSKKKSKRKSRR